VPSAPPVPRTILDDDLLPPKGRELPRNDALDDIRCAAGREPDHHANRLGWVSRAAAWAKATHGSQKGTAAAARLKQRMSSLGMFLAVMHIEYYANGQTGASSARAV
jgi:hypothetical protein